MLPSHFTLGSYICWRSLLHCRTAPLRRSLMTSVSTMTSTSEADHELIVTLHKLSKKSPKLVRSTTYPAPADPKVTIRSWKMNEFKYYDVPSPFPTLARGIFTQWDGEGEAEYKGEGSSNGKHRIVARGYDKFFNIGEVPWTSVCYFFSSFSIPQRFCSGKRLKLTLCRRMS